MVKSDKVVLSFLFLFILSVVLGLMLLPDDFDSDKLMKEHYQDVKLASLTNFEWDYAIMGENDPFQKIDFYKDGIMVYIDSLEIDPYGDYAPQYMINRKKQDWKLGHNFYYKCSYDSYVRYTDKEVVSENKGFIYNYEPAAGCVVEKEVM